MKGGIEVRLPAIPAEVGEMGVVEKLHGFPTPAALIEHLERHAGMHYGTAGPAFIEWASSQAGELAEHLRVRVDELVGQWVPDGSHSQVARVAKRFCLVAVAGELATAHGLTGWPQGEAVEARVAASKAGSNCAAARATRTRLKPCGRYSISSPRTATTVSCG